MYPDLVLVSNLYAVDRKQDRLRHEHEQLVGAVQRAQKEVADTTARCVAAAAALGKAKDGDRANARELDGYVQKRDTTKKLLDSGAAPNYEAAVKQYDSCVRIVDELETKALEWMDAVEAANAEDRAAKEALAKAEAGLKEARAALGARDAPIRKELTELLAEREGHAAALPAELRTPYQELRRKKRPVLVNVVEGSCSSCQQRVPPQRLIETQLNKALHTCPGCGGYLLP